MEIPNYEGELIESIEALAILYNISEDRLKSIVNRSSVHYRPIAPIIKENGKIRQIYNVVWPLKRLQRQTVDSIFHRVAYPSYLQGSIKAENGISRDYIVDATRHAAYNIIMRFDIEDFFPSIKYGLVLSIWHDFFRFPLQVAHTLAKATTYQAFLPQGASTSSYIANLVFWDREPQLEAKLAQYGFFYTRYVDDINISSNERLDNKTISYITTQVYGMILSRGLKPNRMKRRVQTRAYKKTIHNLNINARVPTKDVQRRSNIRAAVKECELKAGTVRSGAEYEALFYSTLGRVAEMKRLHFHEAHRLMQRLDEIKPILSDRI